MTIILHYFRFLFFFLFLSFRFYPISLFFFMLSLKERWGYGPDWCPARGKGAKGAPLCIMVQNRRKQRIHSFSHEWRSECSEQASERVSAVKCASEASRVEQANEQMDERVAQYLRLDSWLIWPTVLLCFTTAIHFSQSETICTRPTCRKFGWNSKSDQLEGRSYRSCHNRNAISLRRLYPKS